MRGRKNDLRVLGLFDLPPEDATTPEDCQHPNPFEEKTVTIWPGESVSRFTWTCRQCGNIRGRMP